MQVLQAAADLRRVEDGPLLLEARLAHVVDVKLQVSPVHERQHQAQRVLGLVGVRQADLEGRREESCDTPETAPRFPARPRRRLTTNLLLTFSRICFSFSAMDSPFLFLILFFSSFLQAYIFPVART